MKTEKIKLSKAISVEGEITNEIKINLDIDFGVLVEVGKPISEVNPLNTNAILWRPKSEAEETLCLISQISNITERELKKLSAVDVNKIMELVRPFLDGSQATE